MSCIWKEFQDECVHQNTLTQKPFYFFWFLDQDFYISEIFYKIFKIKLKTGFSITGKNFLVPSSFMSL